MMDLLQAQTPASKLVLHVIVLPHLSTVRHHNFKLNPFTSFLFPLLFYQTSSLTIFNSLSFRRSVHLRPNLLTFTLLKLDI